MFSTTDGWGARHLHAFALRPGLRRELDLPRELIDPLRRTLALPTEPRLRALAETLATLPTPDQGPLEAIEIQVFARRYDPATLAPSGELLRGVVVRFDERLSSRLRLTLLALLLHPVGPWPVRAALLGLAGLGLLSPRALASAALWLAVAALAALRVVLDWPMPTTTPTCSRTSPSRSASRASRAPRHASRATRAS